MKRRNGMREEVERQANANVQNLMERAQLADRLEEALKEARKGIDIAFHAKTRLEITAGLKAARRAIESVLGGESSPVI